MTANVAGVNAAKRAGFWLSLLFMNAALTLRFPEHQVWQSYSSISLDLVALLLVFALWGMRRRDFPRASHWVLLPLFVLWRVQRIADGIERGAYLRDFNWSLDLPLLPEFCRLFYATLPRATFAVAIVGSVLALSALAYAMRRALISLAAGMASVERARSVAVAIGLLSVFSSCLRADTIFAPSLLLRVATEVGFARHLGGHRRAHLRRIAAVQSALQSGPSDLLRLRGRNVYLFVVESYGQAALQQPALWARVGPAYRRFEAQLTGRGFRIASTLLDSPTYGGRSWLAQATLLSGVPVHDQIEFELLRGAHVKTLAQVFHDAGYRTVLAQPGTVRESSAPDLLRFERHYFARDLDYHGPHFGWATMPDQFVLDAVRRRESSDLGRPRFFCYALVSSHVPWSDLPPVVDDWSSLGDGAIYLELPNQHYQTHWLSLAGAGPAYADAIVYDLEVLRRFIGDFIEDDSLIIILGDHQPHSDVSERSPSSAVPVHVLSRNAAFVDPFRARGYTPGMLADQARPHSGLQSLMLDLLADFSLSADRGKH